MDYLSPPCDQPRFRREGNLGMADFHCILKGLRRHGVVSSAGKAKRSLAHLVPTTRHFALL